VKCEQHNLELHQPPAGYGKDGYGAAFGCERYLPVPLLQVESHQVLGLSQFVDLRQGVGIVFRNFIYFLEVDAKARSSDLLSDRTITTRELHGLAEGSIISFL